MVTLRSGKAVPYLGKNVPKRKTAKKTKKNNSEPSKKPNDSKLSEKPDKSTTPNFQKKSSEKETTPTVQATVSTSNQPKIAAAVQNEDMNATNESKKIATPQPVVVFDDSNPIPVNDFNGVPSYHASTSRENEFSVSFNDISGTTNQSKHSVLDESSDDSAETMIDDSFEITDYDYDQLQHESAENNEAFQMQEPAVRICLPVRGTTDENKEPNVSRAEDGDDNNDEVKRKPLTDLCSVTNISWF